MTRLAWLTAACMAAAAGSASAQSFNCARASTMVEHAICADRDLCRKDDTNALML